MDWLPLETADGSWTLVHPVHGEACHAREGAWTEATLRYAEPCELRSRALAGVRALRLLDVGTGLGLNLAAALAALEGTGARLEAVGLEADPGAVAAGIALYERRSTPSAHFEPWHADVRRSLAAALEVGDGCAVPLGPAGSLRLLLGDARETLGRLPEGFRADAVFLDPFSPRREPALWEAAFLAAVARRMAPGAVLSTFSAARAVRERLSAAGLAVRPGPAVGRKREGTIARKGAVRAEAPPSIA